MIWATKPENENLSSLISNIRNYAYTFLENSGIVLTLNLADNLTPYAINSETHRNIYLILKETLSNVVKHSEAKEVKINFIADTNKWFKLEVIDNGKGFNINGFNDRNGLSSLKKRISKIKDGKLELKSEPGVGTSVMIEGKLA